MIVRILLVSMFVCVIFLLVGCWDYEEYEDLVQVLGIGIDFDIETRETIMTVQYMPTTDTQQSGGSADPAQKGIVHSATDRHIYGALEKLQQVTYRKLFFGYLKVVIIGEEAAKNNMLDIVELFDRSPLLRSSVDLVFTSGLAEKALGTYDVTLSEPSSIHLLDLINVAKGTGVAYSVSLLDFKRMLLTSGLEATAPRAITISKARELDARGGIDEDIKYDLEREGDHRVAGTAAFKGDKFVGWLDEQESLGYGLITGKKPSAYKVSETSETAATEDMLFFRVSRSKGGISVEIDNNKPNFLVDVKVTADLRKYYTNQGEDFLGPKEVTEMEEKLAESIRTDIDAALIRGQQELQTDIFGFGYALYRENPKLWRADFEEKWDEIFPDLQIKVNVEAKVIHTGTTNRQLDIK